MFDQNRDLFEGLGCVSDYICNFALKPDATQFIDASWRVPFGLKGALKEELAELENLGIICKVKEPTEWASGKIRLCIDPHKLNQAIMRPHYQFPTLDEIKADLSGAKFFTTNEGFWMLKLNEASSMFCTFITPFGRYQFTRLPFDINAEPEIFHREMMKLFGDIEGVKIMMDDFLIYGKTVDEHNERLQKVLDHTRQINLKFNKENSVFCQSSVKYLGHIFDHNVVKKYSLVMVRSASARGWGN